MRTSVLTAIVALALLPTACAMGRRGPSPEVETETEAVLKPGKIEDVMGDVQVELQNVQKTLNQLLTVTNSLHHDSSVASEQIETLTQNTQNAAFQLDEQRRLFQEAAKKLDVQRQTKVWASFIGLLVFALFCPAFAFTGWQRWIAIGGMIAGVTVALGVWFVPIAL